MSFAIAPAPKILRGHPDDARFYTGLGAVLEWRVLQVLEGMHLPACGVCGFGACTRATRAGSSFCPRHGPRGPDEDPR